MKITIIVASSDLEIVLKGPISSPFSIDAILGRYFWLGLTFLWHISIGMCWSDWVGLILHELMIFLVLVNFFTAYQKTLAIRDYDAIRDHKVH